jgi:Fe-S cluster assembly ATP-binding protein
MLEIEDLRVSIDEKEILHGINLRIKTGETHALFGPNGAGKSTLLCAIMGFPRYRITRGRISFHGQDITRMPMDERARLGIGMSFQRPPVVRGVRTYDMVAACLKGHTYRGTSTTGSPEVRSSAPSCCSFWHSGPIWPCWMNLNPE